MAVTSANVILLPEMGASCMEEPPIWISGVIALEDEAACFVFGVMATVKSVSQMKKNEKALSFS